MVRRKKKDEFVPVDEKYIVKDATEILSTAMDRFSKTTILARALPDVRDGLKPVHRRIIYTMKKHHVGSSDKFMKLAKISGLVLGYHPHGSAAVSDASVLLSQSWNQRVKLINIEGNNGSLDGDPAAADRYIEARLTPEAELMIDSLDEDTVDFVPNFDDTTVEPTVLPVSWPVLFTNGAMGIATGFSTNIAPHNPVELLKASEYLNRNEDATLSEIMRYVKGPDFPTGGIIMGRNDIRELYKTGKASLTTRGKVEVEGNTLIITELPYGVYKKTLIESIYNTIVDNNVDNLIKDIRDESAGLGVRIVIELNKKADEDVILNLLYKKSQLQINFAANHVAILDGRPTKVGLIPYLKSFLNFRYEVLTRKLNNELGNRQSRLELVEGFIRMVDIADDILQLMKISKGKVDAAKRLVKEFKFTQRQAEAIVVMPLYKVSNQDLKALKSEEKDLNKRIKEITKLLKSKKEFTAFVSADLLETASKFKDFKRKTEIVKEIEDVDLDMTDLIQEQKVVVVVKPSGVQRMSEQVYENNKDKCDEEVVKVLKTTTTKGIALLTKKGLVMQRIVDEVENSSIRNEVSDLRKEVMTFKSDDEIIDAIDFDIDSLDKNDNVIVSISKLGQVKYSYLNKSFLAFTQKGYLTRSKPYNGLKLDGDEVIHEEILPLKDALKLKYKLKRNSGGRTVEVAIKDLNEQGASGSGSNFLKIKKEDDFAKIV